MGFNTVLLINNDRLMDILRDGEEFVKALVGMAGGGGNSSPIPTTFHAPSGSDLVQTFHADGTATILVGGNQATTLSVKYGDGHRSARNQVGSLEKALNLLGFDIRRQTQKKLEGAIHEAERKLQRAIQNDPSRGGTRAVEYSRFRSWEHEVEFYEKRLDWLREMKTTEEDEHAAAVAASTAEPVVSDDDADYYAVDRNDARVTELTEESEAVLRDDLLGSVPEDGETATESMSIVFDGLEVVVTRSPLDGVHVISITGPGDKDLDSDGSPRMRLYVNEENTYENPSPPEK